MKKITFTLPVYTFQIDFAGIVSNIVYIEWMEIGRLTLPAASYGDSSFNLKRLRGPEPK